MESNHIKGVIEGFDEDFIDIVRAFAEGCPELGLRSFMKFWTDNLFDCIFANRFDPREVLEAIQNINTYLVDVITCVNHGDEQSQIIALYFILCMYIKQPDRFRRKIRLDLGATIIIHRLSQRINCPSLRKDVTFVWKTLRNLKAIDFVEERLIYGPAQLINRGTRKHAQTTGFRLQMSGDDAKEFISNKIEPELEDILNLNIPYEEIKASLQLDQYCDNMSDTPESLSIKNLLGQAKALLS